MPFDSGGPPFIAHEFVVACVAMNASMPLVASLTFFAVATPVVTVVPPTPMPLASSMPRPMNRPPVPVPTHVCTPVAWSMSSVVVDGSHVVGGNIGTQIVPCSTVNGPHVAGFTLSSAGAHLPLRSIVPVPHSTLLQPALASAATRT